MNKNISLALKFLEATKVGNSLFLTLLSFVLASMSRLNFLTNN